MDGSAPALHALLIGVDCYMPNRLPDGSSYPSLAGCVRDIGHVREFLRSKLGVPEGRISQLTATDAGGPEPAEPREEWPTYENIVAAFKRLAETASPGDQVYIHYSGHGGRSPTLFPQVKGAGGLDESLVPTDIGDPGARYVRDLELAHLLEALVGKGLIVAVTLDSCHSGGATRGAGGAAARGIGSVDTTPRPSGSLVAAEDELAETWRALAGEGTRSVALGGGWLPEPKGYTLLAACRPSESAYEYAFDGVERNGALTYWMLDSLRQVGPGLTYKLLHDRVVAKVHSQFERQTPQLQGEATRVVFGGEHVQPQYAVTVMQADGERLLLNAGQAHGVRKGARFAVYPAGVTDYTRVGERLALAEVDEFGATDSRARVTSRLRDGEIEQGAQAVLLDPGGVRLQRVVRVLRGTAGDAHDAAQARVEEALRGAAGFVVPARDGAPADFQVAVNEGGEYEVWDAAGVEVANLRPALQADSPDGAGRVVERLVHLAKYRNVLELDNLDPMSPLARKLVVELAGKQEEYDPADAPAPEPFGDAGNTPVLRPGEWAFLRVKNDSSEVLNVTVLDLQPDWGVAQVYPSASDSYFMPLDPGQEQLLPLQAGLPDGYEEGADVVKVFATLGTTNFRWLELPPLDRPRTRSARGGSAPADALEELLAAVTEERPRTRNLDPAAYPSREWATAQVEVRVQRPGG